MSNLDYPYLGDFGIWRLSPKAERCYACNQEIPVGERFFAFGRPDGHNPAIPEGGTPYHRDCALYVFSNGPKPPELFGYDRPREEYAVILPEPAFDNIPGFWRSARQQYLCRGCAGLIRISERYFDYTGESTMYDRGTPYHRRCAIMAWSPFEDKESHLSGRAPEK